MDFDKDYAPTGCIGMFAVERDPQRIKRMAWEIAKADCHDLSDSRCASRLAFGAERYERLAVAAAVAYKRFEPVEFPRLERGLVV